MKLLKNIIYEYEIELKTGMHIGGTKEAVKIGGTDSPVIRSYRKVDEKGEPEYMPIIPGSSLKGKLRSLLDLKEGHVDPNKDVQTCPEAKKNGEPCPICTLFGIGASEKSKEFIRSRLIFRDAYPTDKTLDQWSKSEDIVEGTEVKGENVINRITSAANPRFIERVPAGSVFEGEIILSIYEGDVEDSLKGKLIEGLNLLKDNYLGGSGSRGYGKIEFKIKGNKEKKAEDYKGDKLDDKDD